jgi:hypothetical protein
MTTPIRLLIVANVMLLGAVAALVTIAMGSSAQAMDRSKPKPIYGTIEFASQVDCDAQGAAVTASRRAVDIDVLTYSSVSFVPTRFVSSLSTRTARIQTGSQSWNTTEVVTSVTSQTQDVYDSDLHMCSARVVLGIR